MKIAEDVLAVMKEQDCTVEKLAKEMKLKQKELRKWIWSRDLTLSELVRLLNHLDSEFYPIIRNRKLKENI